MPGLNALVHIVWIVILLLPNGLCSYPWFVMVLPPPVNNGWLGGVVVSVSDSWSRGRGFDSQLAHHQAMTVGKLLTPMCLCHQAVQFGTGQRAVMLCSQEGNHRSGVALAMRHRLQWFIHLWAQRLCEGDEHLTYAPNWSMVHFTFFTSEQWGYVFLLGSLLSIFEQGLSRTCKLEEFLWNFSQ